ncbi:class I SAM-dependent methyltransferase [Oceanihabitans sp. IOP_32]|uniref:class I SAM-dependent methyltransferase n=1 Tax=Oceanihabitans sp. IOP_32 TaxID=2529032 RepID=UPI0012940CE4|nr:class I SAM-dependent methyltransferase [Oceanihabitans sp. IOP_32]QFZ55336.1 class I SAM-dependent methyltransferase [Oceanihabitans sp. IOP_32]
MKNKIKVFDENALDYDNWFERHNTAFQTELLAIKQAIPLHKKGIEIGVGTGRFAEYFGITDGVEPSENMTQIAEQRGIKVIKAVAEDLPIKSESFDFALLVTTVCFLNDIPKAFSEIRRILKPKGEIIVAIIDKNSALGKKYEAKKAKNKFYKDAHFHSTEDITAWLTQAGFHKFEYWQTLFKENSEQIEEPKEGFGKGSFVVIKAQK